jgi:hypothetical protein
MIQIATTPNEANAAIIKGFLENHGIQASYAPNMSRKGMIASCTVYCIENKKEEALELLKKEGLLTS